MDTFPKKKIRVAVAYVTPDGGKAHERSFPRRPGEPPWRLIARSIEHVDFEVWGDPRPMNGGTNEHGLIFPPQSKAQK